ncbi:uncharacterized protein RMCC_0506, partial [Mycolicibacterium canariasense]
MTDGLDLWIVDTETTGLDEHIHVPIEVAAVNYHTGEVISFVPYVSPEDLAAADPKAMALNRYAERDLASQALGPYETAARYESLFRALQGQRLGGANPRFDAVMLCSGYGRAIPRSIHSAVPEDGEQFPLVPESWHHRLPAVESYVAGALGLEPWDVPSLAQAGQLLSVDRSPDS